MTDRQGRRLALFAACGAAALAIAGVAQAQTASETAGPVTTGGSSVSEVVVTAQKRVQNVQDVPEQVTVVSSQFIDQLHATSLGDLADYVPGLQATSGGTPGQTTLSLRGITPVASNVTVGTYVGDVPVGGSSLYSNAEAFSLDLLPYDISSIEVLSGPQGTLYGASTIGGLLKYDLTQPSLRAFHGEVGGDIQGVENGSGAGGGVRATLNGPILQDTLGFVASYALEDTPGYVDNVQTGQNGENGVRQQGARLGLLWRPDQNLRVELNGLYQQIDADGLSEVALKPTTLQPLYGELKDDNYAAQSFRKEITVLSDRTSYDFGFADLTSITSYEYTNVEQTTDATRIYGTLVSAVGGPNPTVAPFDQHIRHLRAQQLAAGGAAGHRERRDDHPVLGRGAGRPQRLQPARRHLHPVDLSRVRGLRRRHLARYAALGSAGRATIRLQQPDLCPGHRRVVGSAC
jgi:iron complex outermembrane receptor protein